MPSRRFTRVRLNQLINSGCFWGVSASNPTGAPAPLAFKEQVLRLFGTTFFQENGGMASQRSKQIVNVIIHYDRDGACVSIARLCCCTNDTRLKHACVFKRGCVCVPCSQWCHEASPQTSWVRGTTQFQLERSIIDTGKWMATSNWINYWLDALYHIQNIRLCCAFGWSRF